MSLCADGLNAFLKNNLKIKKRMTLVISNGRAILMTLKSFIKSIEQYGF